MGIAVMLRQLDAKSRRTPSACVAAALLASAVCLGCQSGLPDGGKIAKTLDVREKLSWKSEEAPPPPQIPSRIVTTWTHAVRHTPGVPAQRGFGGRIVFFGADMDDPIRVDGQLVVYAFDEEGRQEYETQPTKRYIFRADAFAKHEGESQLGPSYSVWIPWDEVGGSQKNISLITRFEPAGGPIVVGEQTRHLLPGAAQQYAEAEAAAKSGRSVLLTGHSESQSSAAANVESALANEDVAPSSTSRASTTIELPENLQQRLQRVRTQNTKLRAIQQRAANRANLNKASTSTEGRRQIDEGAIKTTAERKSEDEASSPLATTVGRYVNGRSARGLPTGATHEERR
jgi:hypothetical protein